MFTLIWETLNLNISAPGQKLKKSGAQNYWQEITQSNAPIIFFLASKLSKEM